MRKYVFFAAILVSQPVLAQAPKSFHFDVTAEDINMIAGALGERPYKDVARLLMKLDGQLAEQNRPSAPEKPKDEPKQEEKPADGQK